MLRITVAGLLLLHGIRKLSAGVGGIASSVAAHGLPHALTYGVYVGEVVAPLLVLLGLWTRPAACAIAINMLVAVYLSHQGDLAHLGKGGGWALELQAFYFVGALCVMLLGAGRFSVSRGAGRLS
jgi:putative oxidoreductase